MQSQLLPSIHGPRVAHIRTLKLYGDLATSTDSTNASLTEEQGSNSQSLLQTITTTVKKTRNPQSNNKERRQIPKMSFVNGGYPRKMPTSRRVARQQQHPAHLRPQRGLRPEPARDLYKDFEIEERSLSQDEDNNLQTAVQVLEETPPTVAACDTKCLHVAIEEQTKVMIEWMASMKLSLVESKKTSTEPESFVLLQPGQPAPDYTCEALYDNSFVTIEPSQYVGKYVVLFFYPVDFTFVCPTEIIAFSDRAEDFRALQCEVIGCSTDSKFDHFAWVRTPRNRGGLGDMNIPLLADNNKKVSRAFGVLQEDAGVAFRALFIINPQNIIRQVIINDMPVGRSVDEVMRLIQAYQFTDEHGEAIFHPLKTPLAQVWRRLYSSQYAKYSTAAHQAKRTSTEKPIIDVPLVKDLFLGRLHKDLLDFPELSSLKEVEELNSFCKPIDTLLLSVSSSGVSTSELLKQLEPFGVFSQTIPSKYGGLGLNSVHCARRIESLGLFPNVALDVETHQSLCVKCIREWGSEAQQEKFLTPIVNRHRRGTVAFYEDVGEEDVSQIRTKATLSPDGNFLLSGTKTWVVNAPFADYILVLAHVQMDSNSKDEKLQVFVVDKGISQQGTVQLLDVEEDEALPFGEMAVSHVRFSECRVSRENMLQIPGDPVESLRRLSNLGRCHSAAYAAAFLRRVQNEMIPRLKKVKRFEHPLEEYDMLRLIMACMTSEVYVLESLAYFLAGFQDVVETPEGLSLEFACAKVLASECLQQQMNVTLRVIGAAGFSGSHKYGKLWRDVNVLSLLQGNNAALRIAIGRSCLEHVIRHRNEASSFTLNKGFALSWEMKALRYLEIHESWPPSLNVMSGPWALRVFKLRDVAMEALDAHGEAALNDDLLTSRLADVSILLLAVLASVARTARSLCLRLPDANYEAVMTGGFVDRAMWNIDSIFQQIREDTTHSKNIEKRLMKKRAYYCDRPLVGKAEKMK